MHKTLMIALGLGLSGCLVDPSNYPYSGEASSADMQAADMRPGALDMRPASPVCQGESCRCDDRNKCVCERSCALDCGGAKCELDCNASQCQATRLGKGSKVVCKGDERRCNPVRCEGDCDVECDGEDTVCAVDCPAGVRCELSCKGEDSSCGFIQCASEQSCPGGKKVCNGECKR